MYKIIGADGKEYGPVAAEQLRQWLGEGRVTSQTKVKIEHSADWQPLGTVPEFSAQLAAVPPPLASGAVPAKTCGLAIASLVLGMVGFCGITALVGLILGIVALVKINKSQGRLSGNGLAIAGVCVSGFMLLVFIPFMAGLTLPALAQGKTRAQTINCVNNVKQLSLAVRMYASDHDDKFPPSTSWCDAIQKDVGTPNAFRCPANPNQRCAYAFNAKLDGRKTGDVNPQTVLFFESAAGWNGAGGPELMRRPSRHGRTFVVGYVDGHVEQMSEARLSSLRWDP